MKFTVIIGKKEDEIFKDFKYKMDELDEDEKVENEAGNEAGNEDGNEDGKKERKDDRKAIKDEDIILLNDNEVVSLEMTTEDYQVKKDVLANGTPIFGARKD